MMSTQKEQRLEFSYRHELIVIFYGIGCNIGKLLDVPRYMVLLSICIVGNMLEKDGIAAGVVGCWMF